MISIFFILCYNMFVCGSDNMKKVFMLLIICLVCIVGCVGCNKEEKEEGKVVFTLFYGNTCPHCQELEEFIDSLDSKTKDKFILKTYEVYDDFGNNALKNKTAKKYDISCEGVPCYFIGEKGFYGYAATFNERIKKTIDEEYNNKHFADQVEE